MGNESGLLAERLSGKCFIAVDAMRRFFIGSAFQSQSAESTLPSGSLRRLAAVSQFQAGEIALSPGSPGRGCRLPDAPRSTRTKEESSDAKFVHQRIREPRPSMKAP